MDVSSLRYNSWALPKPGQKQRNHKTDMWQIIKETFVEFARTSTCHGIARIVDDTQSKILRCGWTLFVCFMLFVAFSSIFFSARTFLLYPSKNSEYIIEERNAVIDLENSMLPIIHICETSFFNKTILEGYGINDELASYLLLMLSPLLLSEDLTHQHDRQRALAEKLATTVRNTSLTKIMADAKLSCNYIIASCILNSRTYSGKDCCRNFFGDKTFVTVSGTCVSTYFSNSTIVQTKLSPFHGMVVNVRANPDQSSVDFDGTIISTVVATRKGFLYSASGNATHPVVWLQSHGQYAPPGQWVSIGVSKTRFDNSGLNDYVRDDNCVPADGKMADEYKKRLAPAFRRYNYFNCMHTQLDSFLQSKANCTIVVEPGTVDFLERGYCTPKDLVNFTLSYVIGFNEKDSSTVLGKCINDCIYDVYTLSPSYASLSYGKDSMVVEIENSSLASTLHFYYPSYTYTVIKSSYPSLNNWIGELGGNLGLFIGASAVTLFEVLVMLCKCVKGALCQESKTQICPEKRVNRLK